MPDYSKEVWVELTLTNGQKFYMTKTDFEYWQRNIGQTVPRMTQMNKGFELTFASKEEIKLRKFEKDSFWVNPTYVIVVKVDKRNVVVE